MTLQRELPLPRWVPPDERFPRDLDPGFIAPDPRTRPDPTSGPARTSGVALPRSPQHRRGRRPAPHRRVLLRLIVLIVFVGLLDGTFSFSKAMTAPGQTPLSVRSVEWLRGIGGAPIVSWVERTWYTHNAPKVGGQPRPGLIPGRADARTPAPPPARALPAPIPTVTSPALAGEGVWHAAGRTVNGQSAVYEAFVRPDAVHTSLVTGVAWMDPHLLAFKTFAGAEEPGGSWAAQSPIPIAIRTSLVAAFNSGFRLRDAHGGYFADGRTVGHLVNGAASFVVRADGTATVGQWGRDVTAGPSVVAVRQNLSLLVDRGAPVPGLAHDSLAKWGATLGNQVLVWRSGVGVTASGAIVYTGGPGLSVASLASVLSRAGAVRAMELDINTTWVNYFTFDPAPGSSASGVNGTKLLAGMARPSSRYFRTTARDFIAAFAR